MLESAVRGLHTSNDCFAYCLPWSFGLPPVDCWSFIAWLRVWFTVVQDVILRFLTMKLLHNSFFQTLYLSLPSVFWPRRHRLTMTVHRSTTVKGQ